ncbi:MAG: Myo-inositol 2-dehydrogenase, partial [uncultured Thermoleophilia bacterium]
ARRTGGRGADRGLPRPRPGRHRRRGPRVGGRRGPGQGSRRGGVHGGRVGRGRRRARRAGRRRARHRRGHARPRGADPPRPRRPPAVLLREADRPRPRDHGRRRRARRPDRHDAADGLPAPLRPGLHGRPRGRRVGPPRPALPGPAGGPRPRAAARGLRARVGRHLPRPAHPRLRRPPLADRAGGGRGLRRRIGPRRPDVRALRRRRHGGGGAPARRRRARDPLGHAARPARLRHPDGALRLGGQHRGGARPAHAAPVGGARRGRPDGRLPRLHAPVRRGLPSRARGLRGRRLERRPEPVHGPRRPAGARDRRGRRPLPGRAAPGPDRGGGM